MFSDVVSESTSIVAKFQECSRAGITLRTTAGFVSVEFTVVGRKRARGFLMKVGVLNKANFDLDAPELPPRGSFAAGHKHTASANQVATGRLRRLHGQEPVTE